MTNRLRESVNLFGTILKYVWFKSTPVILFLNKMDLLEEKIQKGNSLLSTYFPEFPKEKDGDLKAVKAFIENLFLSQKPKENRPITAYFTMATNTENIKVVDATVQSIIQTEILQNAGLN